jgi:hypothetical protein
MKKPPGIRGAGSFDYYLSPLRLPSSITTTRPANKTIPIKIHSSIPIIHLHKLSVINIQGMHGLCVSELSGIDSQQLHIMTPEPQKRSWEFMHVSAFSASTAHLKESPCLSRVSISSRYVKRNINLFFGWV